MDRYTIYCTEEQTEKALELGAPIQFASINDIRLGRYIEVKSNNKTYVISTASQMIRWLENQGIYIIVPIPLIKDFTKNDFSKADAFEYRIVINGNEFYIGECLTSEKSILAAIDVALEYLVNNNLIK